MEFNYSMDASPRLQIDPNAPLFASVMGSAADLGGGECVFRTRDGNTHVMTHQVLQALDRCRSFLSIAEHTQSVREILPKVPADGIRRVLESLIARRLLISEADFISDLRGEAVSSSSAPMQMVIRAGSRIDAAQRLLNSLLAATDWHRRVDRIVLLNETSNASVRAALQPALQSLATASGCSVRLVDASEQRDRLRRLAGKESHLQAALSTLFGGDNASVGQRFNLALSLCIGRRALLLDEHMQWPLHRHPEFRRGLELRAVDQVAARFHPTVVDAIAAGSNNPDDALFDEHAEICGADLGAMFANERAGNWRHGDLRGKSLSDFIAEKGTAPVLATYTGSRGYRRGLDVEDQFLLDAQSRQSFNHDRDAYLRQLGQGSVWTGVRQTSLTSRAAMFPLTLDARQPLPFAMPFGASAGAALGNMLRVFRPDAVAVQVPDAIAIAEPLASTSSEIGKRARTPELDAFIADYLGGRLHDIHANAPAARALTAAALLRDLAASADSTLAAYISEYVQFVRSELIGKLQRAAEEAGKDAPLHWLADLRAIVTINGRALIDANAARLAGAAEDIAVLRAQLLQVADALTAWPALWDRIRDDAASAQSPLA